jgi:hypothetical protein
LQAVKDISAEVKTKTHDYIEYEEASRLFTEKDPVLFPDSREHHSAVSGASQPQAVLWSVANIIYQRFVARTPLHRILSDMGDMQGWRIELRRLMLLHLAAPTG